MTDLPELKAIQQESIKQIMTNFEKKLNSLCVTGVGSGKTRIACEVIRNILTSKTEIGKQYVLVLAPTKDILEDEWKKTLTAMELPYVILDRTTFKSNILPQKKKFNATSGTVYLCSYKMLISSSYQRIPNSVFFTNSIPSLIVMDEMHMLTNGCSDKENDKTMFNAIESIPYGKRLGLTATPLVNSLEEIKAIYKILGINKNLDSYEKCSDEEKKRAFYKESFVINPENKKIKILPFVVRECLLKLPLREEEYATIARIKKESTSDMETHSWSSTYLIQGDDATKGKLSTKCVALRGIINNIADDKVIIFDEYVNNLKYLKRLDWIENKNPVLYYGSMKKGDKKKVLDKFRDESNCNILLTDSKIAEVGLNLQVANHVIMMSPGWTAKNIIQCSGRVKRVNQKKNVFIYILMGNYDDKSLKEKYGIKYFPEENKWKKSNLKMNFIEPEPSPFMQEVFSNENQVECEVGNFVRGIQKNPLQQHYIFTKEQLKKIVKDKYKEVIDFKPSGYLYKGKSYLNSQSPLRKSFSDDRTLIEELKIDMDEFPTILESLTPSILVSLFPWSDKETDIRNDLLVFSYVIRVLTEIDDKELFGNFKASLETLNVNLPTLVNGESPITFEGFLKTPGMDLSRFLKGEFFLVDISLIANIKISRLLDTLTYLQKYLDRRKRESFSDDNEDEEKIDWKERMKMIMIMEMVEEK